ncbi:MAG: YidC/Oxa1 family membrane protein insertase [Thermoleophilaceae bacterium]
MFELAIVPQSILDGFESILQFWQGITGSWGVAIILLTFTIRLVILPLTFSSVKSLQKMQVLQPEIKKLQERYKDDKQRQQQEMMRFYKERQVNPLASCLPLLLQVPFFIALFELLRSKSFRQDIEGDESFLFIPDLAENLTGEPAILALMIVLYVGTQLIASLITSIGGDKTQQRIMLALPFVFVVFIINFEAGLIVYWITTNVWTIGQQLVVRKLYPRPDLSTADQEPDDKPPPARGKPPRPAGGKPARAGAAVAAGRAGGSANGGTPKAPRGSPRKKKKRSGRRR